MIYDKPLSINEYFLSYGRYLHEEKWDDIAIEFLYKKPSNKNEEDLKKLAKKTEKELRKNLWNDIEKFEVSDNGRAFYEFRGHVKAIHYLDSVCLDIEDNQRSCRVLLKKDHHFNRLSEHELFDKDIPPSVLSKYKGILVSEAVLKHLHFIGEPQNNEQLVMIIIESFKKTHNGSLDESMVRENVSRMLKFWKIHKP